ncbi:hypothetical protein QX216_13585 [Vibrio parahaemolyticus]|uniref:hypothetical protein n=1 Tax=Vibrio TaxID=662 RepID=UPI000AF797C4|nr:hypothetical protein [Vibrio parahaemolyticus]EJU9974491.1 hypothetical protein [Vibrio alginolyticus]BCN23878.1 hypothetical protein VYA_10700 [Vibrio alfacsensis]EJG1164740.1 hypothetical protein [Vibrio parahaemolyticus]EJL8304557.1 hypothetical protein [Vibrio parahaemolyticus]EJU9846013.1 hypothetical protein [Vibrio parahaemolyticus]
MVEKIGHIKNPLTVIAMFAAIAEISGTTVLPFIEPENQSVYIWFLMFFPIFLVGAFFLTLNFNHRVLYAPSDYKDEKHFINPYGKASPEEQGRKLQEEIEEIEAEDASGNASSTTDANDKEQQAHQSEESVIELRTATHRQLMADVTFAEKLAVNKMSKDLSINFKTDVRFDLPNLRSAAVYDAVGITETEVHAVEVKLFRSRNVDPSRLARVLEQSELVSQHFQGFDPKEFTLHIFAVMDTPNFELGLLEHTLRNFINRYNVKVKLHVTTLNELQNEYQYAPNKAFKSDS